MEQINTDLKKLNIKKFEGYYVHDIKDALKYGTDLYLIFKKLKRKGLIKHIGLSFYDITKEIVALKKFKPDIVQLPYNLMLFKSRYEKYIENLNKKGIKVYARSIFLKGMILKKWNKIPKNFSSIKLNIKLLEDKYGIYNERKKIELTINEIKKK